MKEAGNRALTLLETLGTTVNLIHDMTLNSGTGVFGEVVDDTRLFGLDLTNVTKAVLDIDWEAGPDSVQFIYSVNGYIVLDTGWLDFGGSGVRSVDVTSLLVPGDNRFKATLVSPVVRIVNRYATFGVTLTRTWTGDTPPQPPEPKTDWGKLIVDNWPLIGLGIVGVFAVGYLFQSMRPGR